MPFLSKLNLEIPTNNINKTQEIKKIPVEENFFNENYSKNFQMDNETRFDDTPRMRANELQKQFKELYEKEEISNEAQNKKEMMRKLLMSYQGGSKF